MLLNDPIFQNSEFLTSLIGKRTSRLQAILGIIFLHFADDKTAVERARKHFENAKAIASESHKKSEVMNANWYLAWINYLFDDNKIAIEEAYDSIDWKRQSFSFRVSTVSDLLPSHDFNTFQRLWTKLGKANFENDAQTLLFKAEDRNLEVLRVNRIASVWANDQKREEFRQFAKSQFTQLQDALKNKNKEGIQKITELRLYTALAAQLEPQSSEKIIVDPNPIVSGSVEILDVTKTHPWSYATVNFHSSPADAPNAKKHFWVQFVADEHFPQNWRIYAIGLAVPDSVRVAGGRFDWFAAATRHFVSSK